MVKMRLTRLGDKDNALYRIVVVDGRVARDGAYIEKIGHYNPNTDPAEVVIDVEKAKKWIANGVQPTETVKNLLVKAGVIEKSNNFHQQKLTLKRKRNN